MAEFNYRLASEIVARSVATTWDAAKLEWTLAEIYRLDGEEPTTCLCSHYPVIEVCVLLNTLNGTTAEVGNVCVKKFMGLESDIIFQGLRRIMKDDEKALNRAATLYARKRGWLNNWEYGFCLDTARIRILSAKQLAKRKEINRRVLSRTSR